MNNDALQELVERAKSSWCAATHGHGMTQSQIAAIDELASLVTDNTALREALERIHDFVHDGDSPAYGNLPQVDLASRSYVTLASLIDSEYDAITPSGGPTND